MRLLLAVLLVTAFAHAAAAQDVANCDSYPNVPVNITPVFDEARYDFSQNLTAIQTIASDRQHSIREALTLGVTRYEPVLEFHVPVVIETRADRLSACAYVKHVDVTVGYRNVTVFIASEIPQDSCGFAQVMGHEQKHIAVNRELLREYMPLIKARLEEYLKLYGVFRTENQQYAEGLLRERLKAIMTEVVSQMETENMERQRQVDSPAEYRRVSQSCDGQLARIAERYRERR